MGCTSDGNARLAVQPPNDGYALVRRLPGWGSRPSAIAVGQPTATLLLDLTKELDAILADMHASTRYNIRLGLRRGVVVRQGTERDLPTFCRLLEATGRREGFAPEHETYLSQMYRLLAPRGWLRLFIAEYEGEAVSGALLIAFGDTVFYKRGPGPAATGSTIQTRCCSGNSSSGREPRATAPTISRESSQRAQRRFCVARLSPNR